MRELLCWMISGLLVGCVFMVPAVKFLGDSFDQDMGLYKAHHSISK